LKKNKEGDIIKGPKRWVGVFDSEKAFGLSVQAFEREDFETALARAKDAQLTLILETKGKINLLWFFAHYWWAVILGSFALTIVLFLLYRTFMIKIISQRLKNLSKEEVSLDYLIKDLQTQRFKEKSISDLQFHSMMAKYEKRLEKIKRLKLRLKNKRIGIINTEQEIDNLSKEKKELLSSMKQTQKDYFEKGTLTRKKFFELLAVDKAQLAELEETQETLKERLKKEQLGVFYKVLKFFKFFVRNGKKKKKVKLKDKAVSEKLHEDVSEEDDVKEIKKGSDEEMEDKGKKEDEKEKEEEKKEEDEPIKEVVSSRKAKTHKKAVKKRSGKTFSHLFEIICVFIVIIAVLTLLFFVKGYLVDLFEISSFFVSGSMLFSRNILLAFLFTRAAIVVAVLFLLFIYLLLKINKKKKNPPVKKTVVESPEKTADNKMSASKKMMPKEKVKKKAGFKSVKGAGKYDKKHNTLLKILIVFILPALLLALLFVLQGFVYNLKGLTFAFPLIFFPFFFNAFLFSVFVLVVRVVLIVAVLLLILFSMIFKRKKRFDNDES